MYRYAIEEAKEKKKYIFVWVYETQTDFVLQVLWRLKLLDSQTLVKLGNGSRKFVAKINGEGLA